MDDIYEHKEINHRDDTLVFRRVCDNSNRLEIAFGLFKGDKTQVGESLCKECEDHEPSWLVNNITIFKQFERQGFGGLLLDETCEALQNRTNLSITIVPAGHSRDDIDDGFNLTDWYKRHGFKVDYPGNSYLMRREKRI